MSTASILAAMLCLGDREPTTVRAVGATWDYGKTPIEFEVGTQRGDRLRLAVIWNPYGGKLLGVAYDGWQRVRVRRLSPQPDGTFSVREAEQSLHPLYLDVERNGEGAAAALVLRNGETTVVRATRAE